MFFSKLQSFARDYFTLTSRERKGALVLALIISAQIVIIVWLHYLSPPAEPLITICKPELQSFEMRMAEIKSHQHEKYKPIDKREYQKKPVPVFTYFDPNTATDSEWMALGLSEKQTRVIRNYLNKGGQFREKESLSKMYCITPEQFELLEPWIRIEAKNKPTFASNEAFPKKNKKNSIVELNTADTLQLCELPLIGPGRARMIFKYRERLGGFISESQILEVFTIDSTVLTAIHPYVTIDPGKIRRLNMNSDSLYHPYLNKKAAMAIVAYRKQHGNFIDINGLRLVAVLDEQMWRKVAPYASFE